MMMRSLSSLSCSNSLVACNVYVTAGRMHHSDLLMKILLEAQKQCLSIHSKKVVVVHSFADGPYNRSSFHLAGEVDCVTDVATSIAITATNELETTRDQVELERSRHPFVGMVDHIAVMPLYSAGGDESECSANPTEMSPTGKAARAIGKRLEEVGVRVYYYGDAHADKKPLARVRREETNFFKTEILDDEQGVPIKVKKGSATIGAPKSFVENFNIRLTSNCDIKMAKSLTRFIRERDDGLLGVEALTLPYSNNRYEVAANLLQLDKTSSKDILVRVDKWVDDNIQNSHFSNSNDIIEKCYRVGTTSQQCLSVMNQCQSLARQKFHDDEVATRFKHYLNQPELPAVS
mmetsp:Transcript_32204/g.47573  ORF Transcript_32204/g.47573 Transcript_32204/m.47573 type:complete len:348 (+) Transcript_32204:87-1130(+)|eukprot:CAMPEP_0194210272 /NCGR_PEP_ID=MMETSP0156-20130528/8128_1 /TAXON_ID=33649 /ORGANISM="Thalassionema nitzschioides, Strain L26-B" /LENGTH=347 /DNA_ID=CAMNT_0038937597 /DNA_START=1 /DNA_END=1044 /DNA_ORIENTATION=+